MRIILQVSALLLMLTRIHTEEGKSSQTYITYRQTYITYIPSIVVAAVGTYQARLRVSDKICGSC